MLNTTAWWGEKGLPPVFGTYRSCGILHQPLGTRSKREELVDALVSWIEFWAGLGLRDSSAVPLSSVGLLVYPTPTTRY